VTSATEQPATAKASPRQSRRDPEPTRGEPTLTGAPATRRTWRELLDSLPLADQLRVAIMSSVVIALLAAQVVTVLWAGFYARYDAGRFARALPASIIAAFERGAGADVLGGARRHPAIMSVTLTLPSGEILRQYLRDPVTSGARHKLFERTEFHHRVLQLLALEPIPIVRPVDLGPQVSGSMLALVDHRVLWGAVGREVGQLPIGLAIGALLAFLAANALQRQIVEPLAQLASATRVGSWNAASEQPITSDRRNELNELASNFDALAARLAEYERDFRNVRMESGQQVIERTRELEQRARTAEALTRSKDEFLANMSHEIRTPMNGVLGMAELLAGTKLDKRQQRFVESMRTAAQTMMQIINDILDDSKIEAGKLDLLREPFQVRELVEDVGQLFAGAAERKRLELICRVEATVPHKVVGDVLRLRQVLGNLLSNAVKYTERGEIQVRVADDTASDGGRRLRFSVTDTGPGIPSSQHAAVFEAYTQLENATRIGGTGLGLSIATRLVRLMGGGRIDLRSEPGHGSTFSFLLPFEVAERESAGEENNQEFTGLRVLIVDDSTQSYMGLEEALKTWSAEVSVLNRGRMLAERLRSAALRSQPFDVVLLDHGLPDASTAELLREIRMDPSVAGTYVVLLTALDFDATYEGTKAIEPDTCIAKPVRLESLKAALRAARAPRTTARGSTIVGGSKASGSTTAALGLAVLVVDDNPVNREVAVAMLEESRCRVTLAHDGHAAVREARERRFDVILMDCQMPGMDGFTATAEIRRSESERGVPPTAIVALTANVLARDRERCLAAGMNGFLGKPFTSAQLIAALRPIAEACGTLHLIETPAEPVDPEESVPVTADAQAVLSAEEESELFDPAVTDMLAAPLFEPATKSLLPVLDLEQIKAIRSLGKPHVLDRLCQLLFETAPTTLQSVDRCLAAGDLPAVAAAAHSLKSASSNLGGRRFAEVLDRCESMARDGADVKAIRAVAAGLRPTYAAFETALKQANSRKTGT